MSDKHTSEPYEAVRLKSQNTHDEMIAYVSKCIRSGGNDFYFISQKGIEGEPDICHMGNGPKSLANAQRIVLCVNALAGIENPEPFLKVMKDCIEMSIENDCFAPVNLNYLKEALSLFPKEAVKDG